ncbi:MAG TPA: hypothetical protein VJG67_03775 [Candidatus Paceibacterota bacterium]
MSTTALTLEEFEERCRVGAELLLEELHDPSKRKEEWGLVLDNGVRRNLLMNFDTGCYGVILNAGENGWDMSLLKFNRPKSTNTSDEPKE